MRKFLQIILAMAIVFTQIPFQVFATTYESEPLASGVYEIKNFAKHESKDEESMARKYLNESSQLEVNENGMFLTLSFTGKKMMAQHQITVNGESTAFEIMDETDNELVIQFKLDRIEDDILISTKVLGSMSVKFRVLLNQETLNKIEDDVEVPSLPDATPDDELSLANGRYNVTNKALKVDSEEESLASQYLNPVSQLEINETQRSLLLTFSGKSMMKNHQVFVNGIEVPIEINERAGDEVQFRFNLLSLKDEIVVKTEVLGTMNVEFRVLLDLNSIEIADGTIEDITPPTEDELPSEGQPTLPEESKLPIGNYTILNNALHSEKDELSMARKYLNAVSDLTVLESSMSLVLKFTGKSMMDQHKIYVNGQEVPYDVVYDNEDEIHLKFTLTRLDDQIKLSTKVLGSMDVTFRLLLNKDSVQKYDESNPRPEPEPAPLPEVDPDEDEDEIVVEEDEDEVLTDEIPDLKDGTYSIKNEVKSDSTIGYQAARQSLNELSYVEVKQGTNYVTFGFGQLDLMNNLRVYVNGKQVSYEVVSQNKTQHTLDLKFKITNLSDKITIKAYVSAIERDISFEVKLVADQLKLIAASELTKPLGTTSDVIDESIINTDLKNADPASETDLLVEALQSIKTYSILNEVISDSKIGKVMARKYLDEMSYLEDVDGTLYLSLTFSGTDAMDNFKFLVNGVEVSSELVNSQPSDGTKTFRFKILDITDDIRITLYVKPVKMNIEFGVALRPETQQLISEQFINVEEAGNDKVPATEPIQIVTQEVSVWKIAIITSIMTTVLNLFVNGLCSRIKKNKQIIG